MSSVRPDAHFWIDRLHLTPHPEGGYFRQTYSAETSINLSCLPSGFTGSRSASTAIYFLLERDNFSAFHRIRSDELWHFYTGDPLEILVIDAAGALETIQLGGDLAPGQTFQAVVKAGNWFASRLAAGGEFALVGCTVSPGFHFDDFELAARTKLTAAYPEHSTVIQQLSRS